MMFGLTTLGIFHTIISLFAVASGAGALIRDGKISWDNSIGKFYVVTTIIVCLTGFVIFQHGGFGKPHALGVMTLVVLGVIYAAHWRDFTEITNHHSVIIAQQFSNLVKYNILIYA